MIPRATPARSSLPPFPLLFLLATCIAALLGASRSEAGNCQMLVPEAPLTQFLYPLDPNLRVSHPRLANCACTQGCQVGYRCYKPELGGVEFEVQGACDPTLGSCTIKARVPMVFPGRSQDLSGGGGGPRVDVREGSTLVSTCGAADGLEINVDEGVLTLEHGFSCLAPAFERTYEVEAIACANVPGCAKPSDTVTVTFSDELLREQLCEPEKNYPCPTQACTTCVGGQAAAPGGPKSASPAAPSGASASVGGHGASTTPPGQPGAVLTHFAGGVGALGTPGASAWRAQLGRYWAHEFAERIVPDPDETHVWLLTRGAYFVEFGGLTSGLGLQPYTTVAPSDEYRTLFFDNDTGGWVLADLDGDLFFFDSQGRWYRSEDRNGNAWVGTLDGLGRLSSVAFPDGQSETFTHDAAGRLATIVRAGVGGSPTRTWSYEWSGPDLIRIRYPDGRARRFEYRAANGFMTHQILEGASDAMRTEQAWSYDDQGNVVRAWRGAANFTDAGAVEKWELAYDNPDLPTETTVTDPLGGIAVYTVGRDTVSRKPKVLSVSGACPVCGSAPDTGFVYDAAHPLRVAMETSPGGTRTDFTYDPLGQVTSRVEAATAAGHPHLPRMTEWEYGTTFPALVTRIEGPAPVGGAATRIAEMTYDGTTGDLLSRTVSGLETTRPGGVFALTTTYSGYHAAGGVGAVDPPGYGTADRTIWTYDVPGRNGMLADSRTDPLVGTWTFGYDAFNRRTAVTDPNGVTATTAYDALDRVTSVTQGGDPGTSADDRVTTYTYNRLGDLYCVKSPTGGGTEHLYDAAGRLVELRRGTAVTTPSATSCLTISSSNIAERQRWSLDGAGHRVNQKLERGTSSSSWTLHSETSWEYGSLCHLDRTIERIDAATSAVTEYAYDCDGNLERVWDPLHPRATYPTQPSTTYAHDAIGRLIATTQPWGGVGGGTVTTSYSYDVQDHLVRVVDGEGTETLYEYSGRDLLTAEESEVSGLTTYVYNEHGALVEETDARLVTVTRTVDAAGRVTDVQYPDPALDIGYTYGTSATGWQKGRLLAIARGASTIDFTYNPFGEILTEGDLAYNYDKNGNRTMITYPGGLVATYAYDRMDRHRSLSVQPSTGPAVPVVTASPGAVYRAFGPVASLTLGTSPAITESRGYDLRYAPTSIALSGGRLAWTYTTDRTGNVLAIDDTTPANQDRTFAHQEWQQYLAAAFGPWGARLFTYDRVGNRLRDSRIHSWDEYSYTRNLAGGNTSRLAELAFDRPAYERAYLFDPAGFLSQTVTDIPRFEVNAAFTFDAAGTLAALDAGGKPLAFEYDGRGLLARAMLGDSPYILPTYTSAGQLLSLHELFFDGSPARRTHLFYFAGRPVAQWREAAGGSGSGTITLLATDHLGTPACALAANATVIWSGGFEPFGRDWQHGTPQGALANGIFLRLPGQWDHPYWHRDLRTDGFGADLFYNVHRWYEPQTGRHISPDPLGMAASLNSFAFVDARPTYLVDPLGLIAVDPGTCSSYCCDLGKAAQQYNDFFRPGWRQRNPKCWNALASKSGKWMPKDNPVLSPLSCMVTGHRDVTVTCNPEAKSPYDCGGTIEGQTFFGPKACDSAQCGSPLNTLFHEQLHRCGAPPEAWGLVTIAAEVTNDCVGK